MTIVNSTQSETVESQQRPAALIAMADNLQDCDVAVMRRSMVIIRRLAHKIEAASVQELSEVVLNDPLMTLKVLACVAPIAYAKQATRPETVTAAILWMGLEPFFEHFLKTKIIEEELSAYPDALAAIRQVMLRSQRAANLAMGLAAQRNDTDCSVVYETALVNDFAEILLWQYWPKQAEQIGQIRRGPPRVPSLDAQRQVLGFSLPQLTRELLARWQMPRLMQRLADPAFEVDRQVLSVQLGISMGRHLESGWSHPEIIHDLEKIAAMLSISLERARVIVDKIGA
ncbi:MAG: HDOD domain-containing protein [Burkholderiaceae bacterium]